MKRSVVSAGAVMLGVAVAFGAARASAAPPSDYEANVKRLEAISAAASDPIEPHKQLLRLHLSALAPRGAAADPARAAASMAIDLLVDDCLRVPENAEEIRSRGENPYTMAKLDPTCAAQVTEYARQAIEGAVSAGDPRRTGLQAELGTRLVRGGAEDLAAPILSVVDTARLARLSPGAFGANDDGDLVGMSLAQLADACRQRSVTTCHARFLEPFLGKMEKKLGPGDRLAAFLLEDVGTAYLFRYDASPLPKAQIALGRGILERSVAARDAGGRLTALPIALAGAYLQEGKYEAIVSLLRRVSESEQAVTAMLLQLTDEGGKRIAGRRLGTQINGALSMSLIGAPSSKELAGGALETVLLGKGRIVDVETESLAILRSSRDPKLRESLIALTRARAELAARVARKRSPQDEVLFRAWVESARQLEIALMREGGEILAKQNAKLPTLADVRGALGDDEALVEIIQYEPLARSMYFLPPLKEGKDGTAEAVRYAAYVLRKDGVRGWADLGDARQIDRDVKAFRAALVDDRLLDPAPTARALYQRTLGKVARFLGDAKRLALSPDGPLSTVPFGALVDEKGRFVATRWGLRYLGSGRDLVRTGAPLAPRQGPQIFGDPSYGKVPGAGAGQRIAKRGVAIGQLSDTAFEPLPATRDEATMAAAMLGGTLLLDNQASETALRRVKGPSVLHLATHGFFLADPTVTLGLRDEEATAILEDPLRTPMLRAGLVLSGFNRHAAVGADDGLVTALEASSLDLAGTKLVVLSACETGLGDSTPGEGIYGLRRALSIAGAETLVMSLWRVPDTATRDLMRGFYAGLGQGLRPSEAMRRSAVAMLDDSVARKAKGEKLITRDHPYFWASFVVSGADTPLTGITITPEGSSPAAGPGPAVHGPRGCACEAGAREASGVRSIPWLLALGVLGWRRRCIVRPCPTKPRYR